MPSVFGAPQRIFSAFQDLPYRYEVGSKRSSGTSSAAFRAPAPMLCVRPFRFSMHVSEYARTHLVVSAPQCSPLGGLRRRGERVSEFHLPLSGDYSKHQLVHRTVSDGKKIGLE